jgi:hypothetical protein
MTNSQSSSGSFSYLDIITASGGEADTFTKTLIDKFKLDFRQRDRKWETYTWLSDNARDAYIACLKSNDQNVFLIPSDNAMNSAEMSITVQLRPFVISRDIPGQVSVSNGTVVGRQTHFIMQPNGRTIFRINRDLTKSLNFAAQVGSEAREISLPPQDPYKYQRELRYSSNITKYGHACDDCHDTHQICVRLDNDDDAVIIPGSAKFNPIVDVQDGLTFSTSPVGPYNSREACLAGGQNVGRNNANLNECGYATAEVLVRIGRDDKQSAKAAPPAYVKDPKTCK